MRLLNTSKLQLKLFVDERQLPEFAILSHRWLEVEALFNDVEKLGKTTPQTLLKQCDSGLHGEKALSWSKICQACIVADGQGYEYIWIDTCCIDKSSSSELNEAINSMYRWYQNSAICYVYLRDVSVTYSSQDDQPALEVFDKQFTRSAWFERGWTLQELLAPSQIQFFNNTWQELSKRPDNALISFEDNESQENESINDEFDHVLDLVAIRTRIPKDILFHQKPLAEISVGARLSWAADRKTTRVEDEAYCLLGIFGINMPLLYGEGKNAFARLQQEIMSHITDQTILAWSSRTIVDADILGQETHEEASFLAPSAANFAACGPLTALRNTSAEGSHVLLKHGLRVSVDLVVGMGTKSIGPKPDEHFYRISRFDEMNVLEIAKETPSSLLASNGEVIIDPVIPGDPYRSNARTAFAVLDCFRPDQPLLYPAIRLRVISWERREFTTSTSRQLVYLRPHYSQLMWLECVGNSQHFPAPSTWSDLARPLRSKVRRRFPAVREQQTAVILDAAKVNMPVDQSFPFRLSISYADDMEETNGLQLRQSWPPETWDLQHGMAYFKFGLPTRRRTILQLTGANGNGIYILMRFDVATARYNNPGPIDPVLYLARCDAEHGLTKVLPFLVDDCDWKPTYGWSHSRLKEHINIGRFQNTTRRACFRIDVSVKNTQVAHSRSGTELCVSVRPSFYGSSERAAVLSSFARYWLRHAAGVVALCIGNLVIWAIYSSVILVIGVLFIMYPWYKYHEHRDRYRYR